MTSGMCVCKGQVRLCARTACSACKGGVAVVGKVCVQVFSIDDSQAGIVCSSSKGRRV